MAVGLIMVSFVGYVIQQASLAVGAKMALETIEEYTIYQEVDGAAKVLYPDGFPLEIYSWFPFEASALDANVVMLCVTTMSTLRGQSSNSASAFRLAAITSFIYVLISYPPILGTVKYFAANDILWWEPAGECHEFFRGQMFLYPKKGPAATMCEASKWTLAGALITFAAMHANTVVCALLFWRNRKEEAEAERRAELGPDSLNDGLLS